MTIPVKEKKSVDPWLAALCIVLAASTVGFMVLAIKNAKPFSCDSSEYIDENRIKCTRIIERGE